MKIKAIPFSQLVKEYQVEGEGFVEVTDRQRALNDISSKTSCCWGAGFKIDQTGWIQLAKPSIQSKGDIRTVFVCRESLVTDVIESTYVPLKSIEIEDLSIPCPNDKNESAWREDEIKRITTEHKRKWDKKHRNK